MSVYIHYNIQIEASTTVDDLREKLMDYMDLLIEVLKRDWFNVQPMFMVVRILKLMFISIYLV